MDFLQAAIFCRRQRWPVGRGGRELLRERGNLRRRFEINIFSLVFLFSRCSERRERVGRLKLSDDPLEADENIQGFPTSNINMIVASLHSVVGAWVSEPTEEEEFELEQLCGVGADPFVPALALPRSFLCQLALPASVLLRQLFSLGQDVTVVTVLVPVLAILVAQVVFVGLVTRFCSSLGGWAVLVCAGPVTLMATVAWGIACLIVALFDTGWAQAVLLELMAVLILEAVGWAFVRVQNSGWWSGTSGKKRN